MDRRLTLLALVVSLVLASPASAKLSSFQSPSGNIGCYISGKGVRCDIKERDWTPPPPPASCDLDYGHGVFVDRKGRADFVCAGDTAIDPDAEVLRYGDSISRGRFRCVSKRSKMKCLNERTDRGFKLSKERVKFL
jgi:hypothetical protein